MQNHGKPYLQGWVVLGVLLVDYWEIPLVKQLSETAQVQLWTPCKRILSAVLTRPSLLLSEHFRVLQFFSGESSNLS